MLTFLDTTVRLGELANLKIEDIDYEQNLFRIMGKGQKERHVPFGRRIAKTLMKYQVKCRPEPLGTDNFWLRQDGRPLLPKRIEKLISTYGKKADVRLDCPVRTYPDFTQSHRCFITYPDHILKVTGMTSTGNLQPFTDSLRLASTISDRHYLDDITACQCFQVTNETFTPYGKVQKTNPFS